VRLASAKHCEAALEAAGILTRQNKLKDALAELDTVDVAKLSHGYWSGSLLAARGSVLAKLGKAADAAAQYRAALRQHPLYPAQKTVYEKALKELQVRDGRR